MTKEEKNEVEAIAIAAPVESVPDAATEELFDFTIDRVGLDQRTGKVYDMLRRVATFTYDATQDMEKYTSLLPDGKVMSRSEVEAVLGKSIEEVLIPQSCCGG